MARLRKDLYAAVIRQEMAFFDETRTGELTNRLASDTSVLQNTVTVNLSMALRFTMGVIGGIGGITDEAKLSMDTSCFAMGQSAGGVKEVKPVAEIVADIMRDAEAAITRSAALLHGVKA